MQNIPTDTQADTHLSNEYVPIALEQLATSNSTENNISKRDFKDQTIRLNAGIEALKSFFLEQIFVVKKLMEEKISQLETLTTLNLWTTNQIPQNRKPNKECHH